MLWRLRARLTKQTNLYEFKHLSIDVIRRGVITMYTVIITSFINTWTQHVTRLQIQKICAHIFVLSNRIVYLKKEEHVITQTVQFFNLKKLGEKCLQWNFFSPRRNSNKLDSKNNSELFVSRHVILQCKHSSPNLNRLTEKKDGVITSGGAISPTSPIYRLAHHSATQVQFLVFRVIGP